MKILTFKTRISLKFFGQGSRFETTCKFGSGSRSEMTHQVGSGSEIICFRSATRKVKARLSSHAINQLRKYGTGTNSILNEKIALLWPVLGIRTIFFGFGSCFSEQFRFGSFRIRICLGSDSDLSQN